MVRLLKIVAVLLLVVACAIILARIVFALPVVERRVDEVALSPPEGLTHWHDDPQLYEYKAILQASDIIAPLSRGTLGLEWTDAVLVSDDPVKGQAAVPRENLLTGQLTRALGTIERRIDGVTPYFVPGTAGLRGSIRRPTRSPVRSRGRPRSETSRCK